MIRVWYCKMGGEGELPNMGDNDPLMREAVTEAYKRLTGVEPDFVLTGWREKLPEEITKVIEASA